MLKEVQSVIYKTQDYSDNDKKTLGGGLCIS